jgi:hypothetical protein
MHIEAYDFGRITIEGKTYTKDLKIIDDVVVPDWWRTEGHTLLRSDIQDVIDAGPQLLVVGTGYSGLMTVSKEVKAGLSDLGIKLIAEPTADACRSFNDLSSDRRVAFAAHLTC